MDPFKPKLDYWGIVAAIKRGCVGSFNGARDAHRSKYLPGGKLKPGRTPGENSSELSS